MLRREVREGRPGRYEKKTEYNDVKVMKEGSGGKKVDQIISI